MPGEQWLPLGQQQSMPQPSNSPVAVSKGMDYFQLIMEHAAFDQHMNIAILDPFQQFHSESRCIIRKGTKVKNITLLVNHTDWPGTEATGFCRQSPGHNRMGIQQIVHRIGIQ